MGYLQDITTAFQKKKLIKEGKPKGSWLHMYYNLLRIPYLSHPSRLGTGSCVTMHNICMADPRLPRVRHLQRLQRSVEPLRGQGRGAPNCAFSCFWLARYAAFISLRKQEDTWTNDIQVKLTVLKA